jgi:hypothetical protein
LETPKERNETIEREKGKGKRERERKREKGEHGSKRVI